MPAVAITDAIPKIRAGLFAALSPLVDDYQGIAKAYWLQAPIGAPLPLLVYQAQDGGGSEDDFLNSAAWTGLYAIRALGSTPVDAETLLAGVPAALAGLSVSGYTARSTFVRSLVLPPLDSVHTAALIYRIALYQ